MDDKLFRLLQRHVRNAFAVPPFQFSNTAQAAGVVTRGLTIPHAGSHSTRTYFAPAI